MNFLRQALAYFFPPNPPPIMPRTCGPYPACSKLKRLGTPPCRPAAKTLPNSATKTLPSSTDRRMQAQLDCELAESFRRAREYELDNPNAVRQDIQRKIDHVLVKRVGRPRKPKTDRADSCGCDEGPCSAPELQKEGILNKMDKVYQPCLPRSIRRASRSSRRNPRQRSISQEQATYDSGSTDDYSDRCSCSRSDCSLRSPTPQRQSTPHDDDPLSVSGSSSHDYITISQGPSCSPCSVLPVNPRSDNNDTGDGVCLTTSVAIRTPSRVPPKGLYLSRSTKRKPGNGNACSASQKPQKRKSKNARNGSGKRAKSR